MAENKKKVVVYTDWLKNFEDLTDEELGKLMRHFFMYINDLDPILEDRLLKIAWNPIETTLKRDLIKWNEFVEKQKENGLKGGRPKESQKTQAFLENPKKADSVSVSVSVSDILLEKETKGLFDVWLDYRKEIKKPIKAEKTMIALAEKIKSMGYNKSKTVIESSITNGWQGLFWDKIEKEGDNSKPDGFKNMVF